MSNPLKLLINFPSFDAGTYFAILISETPANGESYGVGSRCTEELPCWKQGHTSLWEAPGPLIRCIGPFFNKATYGNTKSPRFRAELWFARKERRKMRAINNAEESFEKRPFFVDEEITVLGVICASTITLIELAYLSLIL